jgi:hypothetical protein
MKALCVKKLAPLQTGLNTLVPGVIMGNMLVHMEAVMYLPTPPPVGGGGFPAGCGAAWKAGMRGFRGFDGSAVERVHAAKRVLQSL